MRLSEAFEQYRVERIVFGNRSSKTEESNRYTLHSLIKFYGRDLELPELTLERVRDWRVSLEKKKLSSGTIKGYVVNLRVVLGYMRRLGIECLDPELIMIPKRVDKVPTFLNSKEVAQLIKLSGGKGSVPKVTKIRAQAIISLLYSSGIRVSELCSLNREDVHGDSFTVLGKGQKSRLCFIDSRTRKLLNTYLELRTDSLPALFVSDGRRLQPAAVQAFFRRLTKRAGLHVPVHAHTLRHSYATNLYKNGCHLFTLSRLMGHSSVATTQIYLHIHDPELQEAHKRFHTI